MKKVLITLIIVPFLATIAPFEANAITQNQIDAEVQIVCTDGNDNWFSGSGTIIDPKGIILTNRHVVEDQFDQVLDICVVGFIDSINQEPSFFTSDKLNFAEVKYYTKTSDMDAAILYIRDDINRSYKYINIFSGNSDDLKFGDKIEVIGYPGVGGSTITYTSGDFSGYGSFSNQTHNYIKSTAPLEHGNSGGAAYDNKGNFVGIPTMVYPGQLNSMSYILSVNSIKNWLDGTIGNNYKDKITESQAVITESIDNLNDDITPPKIFLLKNGTMQLDFYNDKYEVIESVPIENNYVNIKDINKRSRAGISFNNTFDKNLLDENDELTSIYKYSNRFDLLEWHGYSTYSFSKATGEQYYNRLTPPINFGFDSNTYFLSIRLVDGNNNTSDEIIIQIDFGDISEDEIGAIEYDSELASRLSGSILLQVESNGEAWYLSPIDDRRYFLGRPNDAFNVMRELGLGAKHDFISSHTYYPDKVVGKILIDVEQNGEAYYIYPKDKKAYFLGRPADAFQIMRNLGLGIANKDLSKIRIESLENKNSPPEGVSGESIYYNNQWVSMTKYCQAKYKRYVVSYKREEGGCGIYNSSGFELFGQ